MTGGVVREPPLGGLVAVMRGEAAVGVMGFEGGFGAVMRGERRR